ncbi:MAG: helix-turn-helix transcriptional regulator [Saprospiraceae bacterium]|nr:helix-turn-helix transcriptional regulator [Saprospiraceae bacterium]
MTTQNVEEKSEICPAQALLKMLSGKWKPEIYRLALSGPLRFNSLLRQINGSNKQSLTTALRELEECGLLERVVVQQKPLHIDYLLTEKGKQLAPVMEQLESLS